MNKRERQKFLKNSGKRDLNKYLKLIKRISQKGGKYRKMYTDDLKFLIKQRGGGCIDDILNKIETCNDINDNKKTVINNIILGVEQNKILKILYGQNYDDSEIDANLKALEDEIELEAQTNKLSKENELLLAKLQAEVNAEVN